MTKKEEKALRIAKEQVVYMLLHNGEQSEEIHERFETATKGMKYGFLWWRAALRYFSQNDAIAAELERMYAWDCWC